MKVSKAFRFVTVLLTVTIVLLSGRQMMVDKNYNTVKSTASSNITIKLTHGGKSIGTVNNVPNNVTTWHHPQKNLQNKSIYWENARQKDEFQEFLEHPSVSEVHEAVAPLVVDKKAIFEPVNISYQAALFDFSKFHPNDFKHEKPVIPHIIHQIWDSHKIPELFRDWIKSVAEQHPDWEYWFWTVSDAECLIRKKYPQYLALFKNYPQNIFRTDAFRYFVLYDYGGFYLDLDIQALKPLDFWTYYYPAVISWENYEHTYLSHKKKEPNIMTTVLASKPQHPFFKRLQENLVKNATVRDVLQATGPFFLHRTYKSYLTSPESKSPNSTIMTIHPRYWLPKHDNYVKTRNGCFIQYKKLTQHGKVMCNELEKVHFSNSIKPDSFLNHFWVHVNVWKAATKARIQKKVFHIKDIVPHAKLVTDILQC